MKNYLICGIRDNLNVVWSWVEFNKILHSNVYEWAYGYNKNSFYTEEEAERHLETLQLRQKRVTNLRIVCM